jgi:hypothetical protein
LPIGKFNAWPILTQSLAPDRRGVSGADRDGLDRAGQAAAQAGEADSPVSSVTIAHARAPQDLSLGAPASDLKTPLSI